MAKRRKRIGAMSTTTTVLLVGGGVLLLYMFMKPTGYATSPITTVPAGTYIPGYGTTTTGMTAAQAAALQAQANASVTNTEINAGANTVNNLINSIFS